MNLESTPISRHHIRLQGPWQVIAPGELDRTEVRLPASWASLFGECSGTATFIRKFNSPTNLTSRDQLFLRFPEGGGRIVSCLLNEIALTALADSPSVFEITSAIQLHNEVAVTVEVVANENGGIDSESCEERGLWQPVILEIVSL